MRRLDITAELTNMKDELYRFALKLTADENEAEELLKDAALIFQNNKDITPSKNLKGWIYTVIRNIFINHYRKVNRDQVYIDYSEDLYHLQNSFTGEEDTEYGMEELRKVVASLPKEYSTPFQMHISGFKYKEIADILDLPLGTVKSRIFFTRQKLQLLSEKGKS